MKNLKEIIKEIKEVCKEHPVIQERIAAFKNIGYDNINYVYVKHNKGLCGATHLPKKQLYRIQIGYAELLKGYPSAWCIDVSSVDVVDDLELPF